MRKEDLPACVDLIAHHPDYGPPYHGRFDLLLQAWSSSLGNDAFTGRVFEDTSDGRTRLVSVGVFVFVTDEFIRDAKTPPFFWLGPELARRITSSTNPLLSDSELCRLNSTAGLNLIPWPMGLSPQDRQQPEFAQAVIPALIQEASGYRVKEVLAQTPVAQELQAMLFAGAVLAQDGDAARPHSPSDLDRIVRSPYLATLTREMALDRVGSWASSLFMYSDPIIGFSRSEQRLLQAALRGLSDEELACKLQISVSAVRKGWRSVYSRVDRSGTGVLPAALLYRESGDRGKGKKQSLLNYVREHPEELRPVSIKLLHPCCSGVGSEGAPSGDLHSRRRVGRPHSKTAGA